MENKDKLLAKIKKLMNLARKNTNPHEAALALERAQKLMREHRLTETDVALTDVSEASSAGAPSNAVNIPMYMCSGSQNQDTFVASFHCFSYSQGDSPPLYLCGLIWLYQFCNQLWISCEA
jgi:Protein of unknown function (DUF2786).